MRMSSGHLVCSSVAHRPCGRLWHTSALPQAPRPRSRCVTRCSSNAEEEAERQANHTAQRLSRLLSGRQRIGSEHGEGFVHIRTDGDSYRLDVDTLNEQLQPTGALRLRHAMKPDEAFGMIFNFDGLVAGVREAQQRAWEALAAQEGLPMSAGGAARPEIYQMSPEYCIMQVFKWSNNRKDAERLAFELAALTSRELAALSEPVNGVREWLTALTNFNVPCALVSRLDKATVRRALERMCLHDHFSALVTSEDDMETISQRLLSASMKLARPPCLCVYYDVCPDGVTAAHNCTMKVVAVQGSFTAYQLKQADVTCASLTELTVYNVRRLFANLGNEFMDLAKENDRQKPRTKRVANAVAP